MCGVDLRAEGTWLGVNLDTGNYGFITNYENLPRKKINLKEYRRANLLLEFLKQKMIFNSRQQYKEYLDHFLKEGSKYNGTNIWLANLHSSQDVYFAHNQTEKNNF